MTSRNYCFTVNNPATELELNEEIKYCIWQKEKGANGTIHYQGYVELKKALRITALKKWGGNWASAHYESRKGTREQARDYCKKKDETFLEGPWEHGDFEKGQGSRNDLDDVIKTMKETRSLKRVAEEHPATYLRYHKGFKAWLDITDTRKRDWPMEIIVYWGEPGSGKSRKAREHDENAYYLGRGNADALWWDGYDGQETVVIDDFYGWIKYDTLLRLCDRYPLRVDYKGGQVNFLSKKIIFTSNRHPREWYKMDCAALMRRITEIWRVDKGVEPIKES